jgi:hypothetical protein
MQNEKLGEMNKDFSRKYDKKYLEAIKPFLGAG